MWEPNVRLRPYCYAGLVTLVSLRTLVGLLNCIYNSILYLIFVLHKMYYTSLCSSDNPLAQLNSETLSFFRTILNSIWMHSCHLCLVRLVGWFGWLGWSGWSCNQAAERLAHPPPSEQALLIYSYFHIH